MGTVRYTVLDGEVIAEKRDGIRREYVPDPLGSTAALIDNTQTKTDTFAYWPYGEEASRTGSTPTPFRYVGAIGYYWDTNIRYYIRARYFDVRVGRWMTQDPMGFVGGDRNLYRYVANTPHSFADPSGKQQRNDGLLYDSCIAVCEAANKAICSRFPFVISDICEWILNMGCPKICKEQCKDPIDKCFKRCAHPDSSTDCTVCCNAACGEQGSAALKRCLAVCEKNQPPLPED